MQIIDFKELISFIEDSPEKSIPKSILIEEIIKMKKESESHIQKAEKRINIAILATILFVLSKTIIVLFHILKTDKLVLMNLYLMDIFIPLIFLIGIFFKKKLAMSGILVYFLTSSYIHLDIQGITILRFIIIFVYSYIYIQGYLASLRYQKHSMLGN